MLIRLYNFSKIQFNTEIYNWQPYVDIVINISGVISSTFVPDVYGEIIVLIT